MSARLAICWWLGVTLSLGGCGRLAFDAAPDASSDTASLPDARPDVPPRSCPPSVLSDEDGDGVDDACDVCPHLVDGQQDEDLDGVGDLCDPQPSIPAEYIAWFDGFNSSLPEWATSNPLVGGQMVIDVTASDSSSVLDLGGSHWRIDLGGEIVEVGPAPHQLLVSGQVAANESYYVEVIDSGGGRRRSLMHDIDTMYTELDGITEPGTAVPVGRLVVELSNLPDQLRGTLGFEANTTYMSSPGIGTIDTFRHVLYVQGLSVVLDYAVVIQAR